MKKAAIHLGIAVFCTAIGASIWLYWNNLLFPARPAPFELEKQVLKSHDLLQSAAMLEDLAYLVETIEAVHPDPYNRIGMSAWKRDLARLENIFLDPLPAARYYFALNSLVNSLGDAHTVLLFEEADQGLALSFEWVAEGMVIAEEHGQFKKGDLILEIGDQNPQELLGGLSEIVSSENIYRVKDQATQSLRRRPVLEHFGLVEDDSVLFTVERGSSVIQIPAAFEVNMPGIENATQELLADRQGWRLDHKNNLGLFYLKVCLDDEEFRKDVLDFFAAVRENRIGNIAIDLRENIGGNSRAIDAFLKQLPVDSYLAYGSTVRYSKQAAERLGMRRRSGITTFAPSTRQVDTVEEPYRGNVFILTGNRTFSSGNWIAVIFHDNGLGTVVGEPTGNAPSSFGDMITFQLPNTGFILGVSYKHFTRPDPSKDPQDSLYPDVLINKTRQDIVNGTDPVVQKIIELAGRGSRGQLILINLARNNRQFR